MSWGAADEVRTEPLRADECWERLLAAQVGRLAFVEEGTPTVQQLAYRVLDGAIVMRCGQGGALDAARRRERVAFEVDDEAPGRGWRWSVLVQGALSVVRERSELDVLHGMWFLPSVDGDGRHYLHLQPERISGQRLVRGPAAASIVLDEEPAMTGPGAPDPA
jgi:uncharacterized protein